MRIKVATLILLVLSLSVSCVGITTPGTSGSIAKFSEAIFIEPSSITDNGTLISLKNDVTINGTLSLNPPVYDDLQINASQARLPASLAPTPRSYLQSQVLGFSASAINVIYFSGQLPHGYKEGTNLDFHIHLAYPDANAGNSTWYFSCSWANMGDNFPIPSETTAIITSPAVANRHQLANINTSLNGAGKKISSVLLCSIQRIGNDGDDTYPSEIYLVSADFHYQKDTLGSRTETVK